MITPTTCSSILSARLKAETQAAHTAAERHPFHVSLFRGLLPLGALAAHHAELALIQSALERRLAASSEPEILAVFRPYHVRAPLFQADLAALATAWPAHATTAAARPFIAEIDAADALTLLGVLYVLEGSTNGGRFIQAAVVKAYAGRIEASAISAMSPHGALQHERWAAFRDSLDSLDLSAPQIDRVVAAATRTFEAVTHLMDEIVNAAGSPARPA